MRSRDFCSGTDTKRAQRLYHAKPFNQSKKGMAAEQLLCKASHDWDAATQFCIADSDHSVAAPSLDALVETLQAEFGDRLAVHVTGDGPPDDALSVLRRGRVDAEGDDTAAIVVVPATSGRPQVGVQEVAFMLHDAAAARASELTLVIPLYALRIGPPVVGAEWCGTALLPVFQAAMPGGWGVVGFSTNVAPVGGRVPIVRCEISGSALRLKVQQRRAPIAGRRLPSAVTGDATRPSRSDDDELKRARAVAENAASSEDIHPLHLIAEVKRVKTGQEGLK